MVKKLKPTVDDDSLANAVRASAAQIWQAGLGAFAKAQEEGGRVFSKLVKEGAELQRSPRKGERSSGSGDKLEQVFEERVARALATMGVPDHDEVAQLRLRVEELSAQVERLAAAVEQGGARPARRAAPAAAATGTVKKPARKAAAKPAAKAVARKAAVRKTGSRSG
ncbi:phasin family protein [Pseudoduganella sp. GCM10020061]|uniref:phasin family protein n=1 Tax=Pseudoduganella sp. GCM10020061 TaxID=3317345 RepID=UPI003644A4AB